MIEEPKRANKHLKELLSVERVKLGTVSQICFKVFPSPKLFVVLKMCFIHLIFIDKYRTMSQDVHGNV